MNQTIQKLPFVEAGALLAAFPLEDCILSFVDKNGFFIIPSVFEEITWGEFAAIYFKSLRPDPASRELPFIKGYVGLLSYDFFAKGSGFDLTHDAPVRIFRVHQAFVGDMKTRTLYLVGKKGIKPPDFLSNLEGKKSWQKDASQLNFIPLQNKQSYLNAVEKIKSFIKDGRFYQLNFLRFFEEEMRVKPSREQVIAYLMDKNEPFSSFFDLKNDQIISLSPERFCLFQPSSLGFQIQTYPIKGTAPRDLSDRFKDEQAAQNLLKSKKDLAELHMIIDLMRNDLNRVCLPGTTKVISSEHLKTYRFVHHLEGLVSGLLDPDQTFGNFFSALCPSGSITGAPKKEVISAIAELESSPRGYLMGNSFYLDDRGHFDSSVLIRTIESRKTFKNGLLRCAAGSGITLLSDGEEEFLEVEAKAKVFCGISANPK